MSTPQSWYDLRNAASDVAEIDIYGEIGAFGVSAGQFRRDLRSVNAKTIKLHINSPGGSVNDGIAIYNSLKEHPARVEVHVDAAAYSIATVIALAGDHITMAPHSRMAIHNAMAMGAGVTVGYAEDFDALAEQAKQVADHLRETSSEIASMYAERSGKEADYWQGRMDEEARFTAEQAVEEGLADEVGHDINLSAFKIAANFELKGFREANAIKAELEEAVEALEEPEEPEAPAPPTEDEPPAEPVSTETNAGPSPREVARRIIESKVLAGSSF